MILERLKNAAAALEQHTHAGMAPYERYPNEAWDFIESKLPSYAPDWYRQITQSFRLGGTWFHFPIDSTRDYIGNFHLPRPSMALMLAYDSWPLPQLMSHGFCAFADGDDGNTWVFRRNDGPDPLIFFIEASAWDGSLPTAENGLFSTNMKMSDLFEYASNWKPENENGA